MRSHVKSGAEMYVNLPKNLYLLKNQKVTDDLVKPNSEGINDTPIKLAKETMKSLKSGDTVLIY